MFLTTDIQFSNLIIDIIYSIMRSRNNLEGSSFCFIISNANALAITTVARFGICQIIHFTISILYTYPVIMLFDPRKCKGLIGIC